MRESLTVLAILLIIILSAALAVPYFVDWDAERSLVETQLSDLLGQQVKIRGGIDLKLLPTPYLQLADVEVADPAKGADMKAAELHLEISLTALMRGEVDFVEARLVRPQIKLRLEGTSLPLRPPAHGLPQQMRFERISVEDGSLAIEDPATKRTFAFKKIALSAEAAALAGPFKGDGRFEMAGEPTAFRFSTGALESNRLRFKLIVDENNLHPRADLDASLIFDSRAAKFTLPSVAGALNLSGHAAGMILLPWQASGALSADLRKATISNLDLRLGDEDHTASLGGTAEFDLGITPRANLTLKAQQIDLDKLLSGDGEPPAMQRVASLLEGLTQSTDLVPFGLPLALEWSADSVLLGGEMLSGLGGGLAISGKEAALLRFEGNGPGRSHLAFDGNVETGAAAGFKGRVEASADDAPRLNAWLAANLPQIMPAGVNLPIRSFAVGGTVNISEVGVVGSDLALRVDDSSLTGTLAYTKGVGPDAARLFVDLTAPALDLDGLPDFSALVQQAKGVDLALRLDAHAVKVGGFGKGGIDAGRIIVKFDRTGANAALENLSVSGLDGADLTASGEWDGHAGKIAAKLDADRLGELLGLMRRFAPGQVADFLVAHADEFSPAHLDLGAQGKMTDAGMLGLAGLSLAGTARQTKIAAKADPDPQNPANLVLSLRFDAQDSTALLRQIGLSTLPFKDAGAASIAITARGGRRLDMSLSALFAGTSIDFHGEVDADPAAPHAAGTVKLTSPDLSDLMRATALAVPDLATRFPADISATIEAGGNGLAFNNLNGTFAGSKIVGSLAYAGADKGITGALQTDKAALGTFVALALGAPQQPRAGALWSDANFAAAQINPPPTSVSMSVASFDLWPQISGRDAHFDLAISGSGTGLQLGLHHLTMKIGAGSAEADLTLRRDGATAAAEGHLHLRDYGFALPSARGQLAADLDLAGTGQSAAALIAGLAGSGTLGFTDLILPKSDPGALARVFNAVEQDQLGIDETEIDRVLSAEFDKQSLPLGKAVFAAGIAAGVLRLTSTPGAGAKIDLGVTEDLDASLDLRDLTIDQRSVLSLIELPRNWSGPPPQVMLNWEGSVSNPARTIDAATFVNALASRAIARASARIQAQEFDLHEHAFFVSRLDSERRRADEKMKAEDDARHAAELEELRKAEAAREEQLKAEEQKSKADEASGSLVQQAPMQIGGAPVPPRRPASTVPAAVAPAVQDPSAAGRY